MSHGRLAAARLDDSSRASLNSSYARCPKSTNSLDFRTALRVDGAGDATSHPERAVGGVDNRNHAPRSDVAFEDGDRERRERKANGHAR